jgi:hypothetical protein
MPSLIRIGMPILEKIIFNINKCKYGFPYCVLTWPLGTMMWTILNLHYIRKLSCKYGLFWLSGSGGFQMTPPHFCNYLPFEEDLSLYLNNLELPLPKDDLCQAWLKFACWFWRRGFLTIFSVFLLFCYYLPLGKGISFHLNNLKSPPPKNDLCHDWSKLAQWFSRRSRKCKSLQTTGNLLEKLTWAFSSGELKALNILYITFIFEEINYQIYFTFVQH